MPFHLNYFMGGMGNQIFQISTLISLADKYDTTFSFPNSISYINGFVGSIPVYNEKIFDEFKNHNRYKDYDTTLININIEVIQFNDINLDGVNDKKNNQIILSGLPMWLPLIDIPIVRNILLNNKNKFNYSLSSTNKTKLCIAFRTFDEEGLQRYMLPIEYYKKALEYIFQILNSDTELYIFTDRENIKDTIIKPILNELNIGISDIFEYKGNRDGISDIEHFYKMMDCDHYILCNSTYHYWPALIKDDCKSIIIYPNKTENNNDNWFKDISPSNWTRIDYFR